MSCNDDKIRNQTCVKKYYYKNGECAPCREPKCHFCYDGIGCIICEEDYKLIEVAV